MIDNRKMYRNVYIFMITNNRKHKSLNKFRNKTIRFRRKGHKYYPVYDIILVFKDRKASTGREIEKLGFFNPQIRERQLFINTERLAYLASRGVHVNKSIKKYLIKFLQW